MDHSVDTDGEEGDEEEESPRRVVEFLSNQKDFVDALKSIKGDVTDKLPTFGGSMHECRRGDRMDGCIELSF